MRSAPLWDCDYLSAFLFFTPVRCLSLNLFPNRGPSLLPNNFTAQKEQLDKNDFIVGYAGNNCFGATACQLGEGLPSEDPQF